MEMHETAYVGLRDINISESGQTVCGDRMAVQVEREKQTGSE